MGGVLWRGGEGCGWEVGGGEGDGWYNIQLIKYNLVAPNLYGCIYNDISTVVVIVNVRRIINFT